MDLNKIMQQPEYVAIGAVIVVGLVGIVVYLLSSGSKGSKKSKKTVISEQPKKEKKTQQQQPQTQQPKKVEKPQATQAQPQAQTTQAKPNKVQEKKAEKPVEKKKKKKSLEDENSLPLPLSQKQKEKLNQAKKAQMEQKQEAKPKENIRALAEEENKGKELPFIGKNGFSLVAGKKKFNKKSDDEEETQETPAPVEETKKETKKDFKEEKGKKGKDVDQEKDTTKEAEGEAQPVKKSIYKSVDQMKKAERTLMGPQGDEEDKKEKEGDDADKKPKKQEKAQEKSPVAAEEKKVSLNKDEGRKRAQVVRDAYATSDDFFAGNVQEKKPEKPKVATNDEATTSPTEVAVAETSDKPNKSANIKGPRAEKKPLFTKEKEKSIPKPKITVNADALKAQSGKSWNTATRGAKIVYEKEGEFPELGNKKAVAKVDSTIQEEVDTEIQG